MIHVYLDTSVFGGYFDAEFNAATIEFFERIDSGYILPYSSLEVLKEIQRAPVHVLNLYDSYRDKMSFIRIDEQAIRLARLYITEKALTEKSGVDALHIALASCNKLDLIVSWNFKHIVNYDRIRLFNATNLKYGFASIDIRSPLELLKAI
jgi:predicted nucleic acid-binding protein